MSEESSEENDVIKEAERTAKFAIDLFNKASEICVQKFEEWARENKNATTSEAHQKLVNLVKSSIISSNMLVMKMTM